VLRNLIILTLILTSLFTGAQNCNRMAKKSVKDLAPFRFNGTLHKVQLSEGESAEVSLVLRGGKKYRILLNGGRASGKLNFKIYDRHQALVFDNAKHDNAQSWDFKIKATQEYHLVVTYPSGDEGYNDTTMRGCVALAVGFLDDNPQ